jgi:hypothetical protein
LPLLDGKYFHFLCNYSKLYDKCRVSVHCRPRDRECVTGVNELLRGLDWLGLVPNDWKKLQICFLSFMHSSFALFVLWQWTDQTHVYRRFMLLASPRRDINYSYSELVKRDFPLSS